MLGDAYPNATPAHGAGQAKELTEALGFVFVSSYNGQQGEMLSIACQAGCSDAVVVKGFDYSLSILGNCSNTPKEIVLSAN